MQVASFSSQKKTLETCSEDGICITISYHQSLLRFAVLQNVTSYPTLLDYTVRDFFKDFDRLYILPMPDQISLVPPGPTPGGPIGRGYGPSTPAPTALAGGIRGGPLPPIIPPLIPGPPPRPRIGPRGGPIPPGSSKSGFPASSISCLI